MLAFTAKCCEGLMLASCRIQSAAASVTLEVFGFLMGDENLQVIKVTLAVVAPRPSEDLLDVGVLSLALAHVAGWDVMIELIAVSFPSRNQLRFDKVKAGLSRSMRCDWG